MFTSVFLTVGFLAMAALACQIAVCQRQESLMHHERAHVRHRTPRWHVFARGTHSNSRSPRDPP